MPSNNPNFDAIYSALASLLLTCSMNFTATVTAGDPVLTGIASTALLSPNLPVQGGGCQPGDFIKSVDSGSQITLATPPTQSGSLSFNGGFVTTNALSMRLLRHWADVGAAEQPAIYLTQVREISEKRISQLAKWTLDTMVWIYVQAPDEETPATPPLNALLGLIRNVLGPDPSGPGRASFRQTLGGLVFDVWIEGTIQTDSGFLGQQAVAKIPIRIIQNGP